MSTRDDAIKFLRGLKLSCMGVTIYQDIIDHVLAALDDSLSSERGARDANGILSRELEAARAECEALRRERDRRTEDGVQRIAKLRVKVAEWEAWSQQYENLLETSKRWLHTSQEWDGDDYLGPMWQDLWNSAPSPTKPTKK